MIFSIKDINGKEFFIYDIDNAKSISDQAKNLLMSAPDNLQEGYKKIVEQIDDKIFNEICNNSIQDREIKLNLSDGKQKKVKYFLVNGMELPAQQRDDIKERIQEGKTEGELYVMVNNDNITGYWSVV